MDDLIYSLPSIGTTSLKRHNKSLVTLERVQGFPTIDVLAPEKWSTIALKKKLDENIAIFYEKQIQYAKQNRTESNKKAIDIFEKILFKLRWSNPPVGSSYQNTVVNYCKVLLSDHPSAIFEDIALLNAFIENSAGLKNEKIVKEIKILYERLKMIVDRRDKVLSDTKENLVDKVEKLTIQKEGKLRWKMETTIGKRETYWTIWNCCNNNGMLTELKRYLLSKEEHRLEIDTPDPDHGLTPLHYACKRGYTDIFQLLMLYNADINIAAPDGRTALHFTAMYGNKEILLELLALGADFYLKDNYGCIAIELANQNKNKQTFEVLQNWFNLIPKDNKSTLESSVNVNNNFEEKEKIIKSKSSNVNNTFEITNFMDQNIPDEYLSTPEDVIERMSRVLRVYTRRLCPLGGNGLNFVKDPFLEMRLCEKHATLSFAEGFSYDAFKSLRRKWRIAKSLIENENESENNKSQINSDANSNFNIGTVLNDFNNSNEEKNVINESVDHTVEFKDHEIENFPSTKFEYFDLEKLASTQNKIIENNNNNKSNQNVPELTNRLEYIQSKDYIPITHIGSFGILISPPAAPALDYTCTPSKVSLSSSSSSPPFSPIWISKKMSICSAIDIGFDLAERCIKEKQEGYAVTILNDCVSIAAKMEHNFSIKLAVASRLAEVLIFLHDLLDYNDCKLPESWQHRICPFAKTREDYLMKKGVVVNSTTVSKDMSLSLSLPMYVSATNGILDFNSAALMVFNQVIDQAREGSFQQIVISSNALDAYRCAALIRTNFVIEEAIAIHEMTFQADVLEPSTLAPLLEIQAEICERKGDFVKAFEVMSRAEKVFMRSLGLMHEETVRVSMEVLRMQMKATSIEGYKFVSQKALEFTRLLVELSKTDALASEKLVKKCAELISLCRLLEEGKFNVHSKRGINASLLLKHPKVQELKPATTTAAVSKVKQREL